MALLDLTLTQPQPRRAGLSLFEFARTAAALHRQRAALRRLDDAQLADLGLTRAEADVEGKRPVWDVPQNWRR